MNKFPFLHKDKTQAPSKTALSAMGPELQALEAYQLRLSGWSFQKIAHHFDVDFPTVKNWCNSARDIHQQFLASQSGFDVIVDTLSELDYLRSLVMDEVTEMRESYVEEDPSGKKTKKKGFNHVANATYLRSAGEISKMKIDFLTKIGAVPTQPDRIHHTITGDVTIETEKSIDSDNRSVAEIEKDLMERLAHTSLLGYVESEESTNETPEGSSQAEED